MLFEFSDIGRAGYVGILSKERPLFSTVNGMKPLVLFNSYDFFAVFSLEAKPVTQICSPFSVQVWQAVNFFSYGGIRLVGLGIGIGIGTGGLKKRGCVKGPRRLSEYML